MELQNYNQLTCVVIFTITMVSAINVFSMGMGTLQSIDNVYFMSPTFCVI